MCVMFSDLKAKSPSERQCVPVRTDMPDPASSFNWPRPPPAAMGTYSSLSFLDRLSPFGPAIPFGIYLEYFSGR